MRKAQAAAGDITLLFADESEALTHPYLAHAWARRGADLRVQAPGQAKKVALMGMQDAATRELIVHTSKTKRSADFVALLETIDRRYGPQPGRTVKPPVLVLDNGPIHTSRLTTKALAARPWLTVEWLPKYAPELNEIELAWPARSRTWGSRHGAGRRWWALPLPCLIDLVLPPLVLVGHLGELGRDRPWPLLGLKRWTRRTRSFSSKAGEAALNRPGVPPDSGRDGFLGDPRVMARPRTS